MSRRLRALAVPLLLGAAAASCTDGTEPVDPVQDVTGSATITVDLAFVGGNPTPTRAGNLEDVRDISIIVADGDGTVEATRRYDSAVNGTVQRNAVFIVTPGPKQIYAIANVPGDVVLPEVGDDASALDDMAYSHDAQANVAMAGTACIAEGDYDADRRGSATVDLVHSSVKWDVTFLNRRLDNVVVEEFGISSVAEPGSANYLFGHTDGTAINREGRFTLTPGWSQWLAAAADESQQHPLDAALADTRGWIMDYTLPAGVSNAPMTWTEFATAELGPGESTSIRTFYTPETVNGLLATSGLHLDADGLEQSYTFSVKLQSISETTETKTFDNIPLPNLRALFRNTHVTLLIKFTHQTVIPVIYTEEWNVLRHPAITL